MRLSVLNPAYFATATVLAGNSRNVTEPLLGSGSVARVYWLGMTN